MRVSKHKLASVYVLQNTNEAFKTQMSFVHEMEKIVYNVFVFQNTNEPFKTQIRNHFKTQMCV